MAKPAHRRTSWRARALRSILSRLKQLHERWSAWLHPRTARVPWKGGFGYLRISAPDTARGPIPLVIGVTGHGKLLESQRPEVEGRVARVLREARSECRYTPLVLLTTLDGEAGRLAARVALDLDYDVTVVAALRSPAKQARKLVDTASRPEFDRLVSSALVLRVPTRRGRRKATLTDAEEYVVANCDLLIALWDGKLDSETAKVVEWQLGGLPSAYTRERGPLDPAGLGPVRHVLCARAGGSRPSVVAERLLEPGPNRPRADETQRPGYLRKRAVRPARQVPPGFEPEAPDPAGKIRRAPWLGDAEWPIREQIHGFNRDAVALRDDLAGTMQKTRSWLQDGLGDIVGPVRDTLEALTLVDGLAQRFRTERIWAIKRTFVAAEVGIVLFILYAHPLHEYPGVLMGYLLCMAYALWQARVAGWYRLEEKHLDYRALAEGLRVQFYWALAGIADPVSEHYLRNQRTELAWIPRAIRSLCVRWGFSGVDGLAPPAVLDRVQAAWVGSELTFFEGKIEDLERQELGFDLASGISFVLALGGALLLLLSSLLGSGAHPGAEPAVAAAAEGELRFQIEITVLALLALFAGFSRVIAEKMGYAAQRRRYVWMRDIHAQVRRLFGQVAGNPTRKRDLLVDLGGYALIENAEWLRVHRDRPLEVPIG
ncbi:MAG: hypothetical protein ACJ8GN_03615 [Longimicrobiaceae bacterium]